VRPGKVDGHQPSKGRDGSPRSEPMV